MMHSTSRTTSSLVRALVCAIVIAGCGRTSGDELSLTERNAIADTLRAEIAAAYDFSAPGDPVARLMRLYPESGPVVSAYGGRVQTSRDTLRRSIESFWQNVGRNMRDAHWQWIETHVDVLSRNAAVLTGTYRVPHIQPNGMAHSIGGAWTALFVRRGGRWVIVQEHLSDAGG
jgi:hypothetical protein